MIYVKVGSLLLPERWSDPLFLLSHILFVLVEVNDLRAGLGISDQRKKTFNNLGKSITIWETKK